MISGFNQNLSRYYVYGEKDMSATKKQNLLSRAKNLTGVIKLKGSTDH